MIAFRGLEEVRGEKSPLAFIVQIVFPVKRA
jgi:hypothetical protein